MLLSRATSHARSRALLSAVQLVSPNITNSLISLSRRDNQISPSPSLTCNPRRSSSNNATKLFSGINSCYNVKQDSSSTDITLLKDSHNRLLPEYPSLQTNQDIYRPSHIVTSTPSTTSVRSYSSSPLSHYQSNKPSLTSSVLNSSVISLTPINPLSSAQSTSLSATSLSPTTNQRRHFAGPGGYGYGYGGPQMGGNKGDYLTTYCQDLTGLAKERKLDPVIGRENEIRRTIEVLSRRRKNNPVLIGEAGVGKTSIVEGLAQRIVANEVPESLKGKRVLSLDLPAVLAGAGVRGKQHCQLTH